MISGNRSLYKSFHRDRQFGLLCAGELHKEGIAADTVRAKYPFYCQVLILSGRGVYEDDRGNRMTLEPGMILRRYPDRHHSLRIDPDSHWHELFLGFGILEFDDPLRQKARTGDDFWKGDIMYPGCNKTGSYLENISLGGEDAPLAARQTGKERDDFRRFYERLERTPSVQLPLLLGECLGLYSRHVLDHLALTLSDNPVDRAREILEDQLERRTPVEELLALVPLSYAHLRERFREEVGISPGRYRIGKRIEAACHLLAGENLSPGETARRLGYEDTSSFSRQFRNYMGQSPGEYITRRDTRTWLGDRTEDTGKAPEKRPLWQR